MNRQVLELYDDGTLDTVFVCTLCEDTIRYSDFPRNDNGIINLSALSDAANEHLDECDNYDFFAK